MWPLLLATISAAHADCTFRASPERLAEALDAAERAYVSLDVPEFERAMTEVDFVVPCLETPAPPATVARLHRMRGLGRFAAGDREGAAASLQAARRLEPDYVFSDEVLPKGFELRDLYEQLPADPPTVERLPRPGRDTVTWLDGTASTARPVDVPTLWQLVQDGSTRETRYLEPGETTPWYPGANKDQLPWLVGAGATAVGAGVAYGAAASLERQVTRPGTGPLRFSDLDALDAHQATTNALVLTSAGLASAAAAELVVGLLKGSRE
jgi:hypothetical protein